ncbi:MAG TPA: hypothetical protein VE226_05315 [Nitrososphaeraceae archaeon]|jgi:hypothetical protein|nr:hypothetical protein [Nitrososphaeraceae archaeon]
MKLLGQHEQLSKVIAAAIAPNADLTVMKKLFVASTGEIDPSD